MMNEYINENEFILNDLKIYREFDMSNFINNAKYSLSNKINSIKLEPCIQQYSEMIQNVVNDLNNLKFDSVTFNEFFTSFTDSTLNNINDDIYINPLIEYDVTTFKPQYLNQYIQNIELIIDRTLNDKINKNDIDYLISSDITNRVKKQIVNTNLPYEYSAKKLIKINRNHDLIKIDENYIKSDIIPFIKSAENTRKTLIEDSSELIKSIDNSNIKIKRFITVLDKIKKDDNISSETIQKLNYVLYNLIRSFIDVVSFISYAMIRKINMFTHNVNTCIDVYNKLQKYTSYANESVLDCTLVTTDYHSLADAIITGRIDAYEEISNQIYEYIYGCFTNNKNSTFFTNSIDTEIENAEYDKTQYEEANKMIIIISQGLDIIAASSDDYLLVFDEIIEKAGFVLRLADRFRGTLSKFDDISEYSSSLNIPVYNTIQPLLFKAIREVKDYPKNMKTLSDNVVDCKTKLSMLQQRFEKNINDRYRNTETIREINIFLEDFTEQYNKLIEITAGKFMERLKSIKTVLIRFLACDELPDVVDGEDSYNDEHISIESVYESLINDYEEITDLIFESMSVSYNIAKQKKERGVNIILEETQNSGNIGNNLISQINKWFDELVTKISGIINSKKDSAYLSKHRQEFLNMDFTNITSKVNIVDYESLQPYSVMNRDMRALASKVNTANLSMAKIQTLKDNNALVTLIFGNNPPSYVWNDKNPTNAITDYYKFGKNRKIEPMKFSGNNLKTIVTNAVTYCESYNNKFLPELKKNITNIKNNLNVVSSAIVNESYIDEIIGNLFIEEENINNNSKQKNIDKLPNIDSKINFIKKYIQQYCTAVMNAATTRYNDYMNLLHSLITDNTQNKNQ